MKKLIAALTLLAMLAIPTLSSGAGAASVSPSSSEFGTNGY